MDNFERALKSMETAEDVPALREGVELIYANFRDFLSQQGVKGKWNACIPISILNCRKR